jgi:hypothetical protein
VLLLVPLACETDVWSITTDTTSKHDIQRMSSNNKNIYSSAYTCSCSGLPLLKFGEILTSSGDGPKK